MKEQIKVRALDLKCGDEIDNKGLDIEVEEVNKVDNRIFVLSSIGNTYVMPINELLSIRR